MRLSTEKMGSLRRGLRVAALGAQIVRHADGYAWLLSRPKESLLGRYLRSRPTMRRIVLTPLISARWNARRRLAVLREHFAMMERIGGSVAVSPSGFEELVNLSGIRPGLHATLDSPWWLMRDGFLTLTLWNGAHRIFTLSFCFGKDDDGVPAAFVGGIQGARTDDIGRLYKELTKAAHGLRPRDLLIDLLRNFCTAVGITRVLGISDDARHHNSRYSRAFIGNDPVKGRYDEIWIDRGGVLRPDGFFLLPAVTPRRARDDISPNKRGMYAARYAMLDRIDAAMRAALATGRIGTEHPNHGVPRRPEATGLSRSRLFLVSSAPDIDAGATVVPRSSERSGERRAGIKAAAG